MLHLSPDAAARLLTRWALAPHPPAASAPGARGRVLVLDGLTGSGKSSLAARLLERLPRARLLAVEEHVPGWDDLAEGAARCGEALRALDAGTATQVPTWDWVAGAPGAPCPVTPLDGGVLVVEGCGALAAAARPLPHLDLVRVLVVAPTPLRTARVARRDGYAWDVGAWEAQERALRRAWRRPDRPWWGPDVLVRQD